MDPGPYMAVERDEVMTVLIFVGCAFLFEGVRRRVAWLLLFVGLAIGIAALMKPTAALLGLCLILPAFLALKKEQVATTQYVIWASAGAGIALALLLGFLLPGHALSAFLFTMRKLVPYYSSLMHPTLSEMVRHSLPNAFLIYLPLAFVLLLTRRIQSNWEMRALWLGFLFGGFSYFIQHKGYYYHRIPFVCFGWLWIGIEFCLAIRDSGWRRLMGATGLAFGALLMVPINVGSIRAQHEVNAGEYVIEDDLNRLGGKGLDGKVECFDMVTGCFSALFRTGIVGSTPFTGDTIFFAKEDNSVASYYRSLMWDDLHRKPPAVIIVSNEWYQISGYSFDKLDAWPQFRDYLNSNYTLIATQGPFTSYGLPMAYRIYVLPRDYPDPPQLKGGR